MEQKISKLTTKEDWGKWRTVFTQLYIDEDHTLPEVMKIMEDKHKVCAR
jgi:hypothetical protein